MPSDRAWSRCPSRHDTIPRNPTLAMHKRALAGLAVAVDTTRRLWAFLIGDMECAEQLALPD